MACLTSKELDSYCGGRLDAAERERVLSHLEGCPPCQKALDRTRARQAPAISGSVGPADVTLDSYRPRPTPIAISGSIGPADVTMDSLPRRTPIAISGSIGPTDVTIAAGAAPPNREPDTQARIAKAPRIEGYQITGVLGQGGMGIVYKAVQTRLNRVVALKVLPAMIGSANPAAVQRFRREATAAARLHHTNIVPIYDFGESADAYYYAMEYIVGQPLDEIIGQVAEKFDSPPTAAQIAQAVSELDLPIPKRSDGSGDGTLSEMPVPGGGGSGVRGRAYFRQVARWICDCAEALNYAHVQGIIHRDIKPSNLILSNDGRIMVADFGLAKSAGEGSVTKTGALVGTLRYLSPEQAMARRMKVDHRTDVYSLGATMYELLCFKPAYPGNDDKEILGAIMTREPVAPRKINSHVPAELEIICQKCLEKSPDARYETARALADDLRRYANDVPIIARRPSLTTRAVKFIRRHKLSVIATAAVVLVAAATILWQRESTARRLAQIDQLNNSAQTLVAVTREWSQADAAVRNALQLDPHHVKSLLTLAWLKLEHYRAAPKEAGDKSLEEAIAASEHALQIAPDDITALGYLGLAQRRLGRYPEAITTLERALRLDQQAFASWSNLGALHVATKNLEQGAKCLRKGADIAGVTEDRWRAATWRNLATFDLFQRSPKVVDDVQKALACDKTDVQSWIVRSRIGLELEGHVNVEEALDDAKHADRLADFKNARAKRVRALAHLANQQWEHAVEQANLAIDLGDEPGINYLVMAAAAAELGREQDARGFLDQADKSWPADLRTPAAFTATTGAGELWIETADERLTLAARTKAVLAAAP